MKKFLVLTVLCVCGFAVNASAQVYQSAQDAANEAKAICNTFGQKATTGTKDDHTGVVKYETGSSYNRSEKAPQSTTTVNGNVGTSTRVVGGNVSASYERNSQQTNSQSNSDRGTSGYIYYKCED